MDISDRLWTWRLARWYVIKMLSPLWCIGLAGNGFKGYFAHKLPLNRQPFKSLEFGYLHVTHTYWHKKGRSDSEVSQSYTYADLLFSFLR